ncbi:hypothetical protein A5757_15685 [Mycobacterium sp. 852013-51886_SCH5428379]|uniref:hypothetical protein n=1 Tax=Mycobacterium sp. 852013-51886_SCH5428379 TaxID=1834111 RepID=UPI000800DAFE|nr:hypothetical protein [Mycobacterium sp. 852013-51886_SCH5428379]OBB58684.1 hypothetical protein A5757_15685 [Mycobacterium sp. 852013-51886_SCH5428379]
MSRSVVARALTLFLVLLMPMTLSGLVAGAAHAQPDDDAEAPGDPTGTTLPWSALGQPSSFELYGSGRSSFTINAPAGLTAVRLQGMIHTPMDVDAGYVEIEDREGNFLASVDIPPPAPGRVMTPFDVDIAAASVRGSATDLTFAIRARDDRERVCRPLPRVELSNLTTVFAGVQLPVTTVANFFAPVLGRVTIYTPNDANAAEQQAALTLASALGRSYAAQQLSIAVVSQPRGAVPPPAFGLERAVVVETGEPGLTVENAGAPEAYLRVSGDGDALSEQLSLIATGLQPLAQARTARVDEAGSDVDPVRDTMTLDDLDVGVMKTDVLGTNSMQAGIQRTTLGPRFDKVDVHLLADYTPVPAGDAASVVVRSKDLVVYRATLDNSGHLDADFTLDSAALDSQWINLDVTLTYTPDQPCGPLVAPMTFQIDPRSTLTVHRGGAPLGGFAASPAEFSPEFVVAFDGSGPNQLDYAARVVAAIARTNKTEMTPQVVDLQTAAEATKGALIVANSKNVQQTSLNPPVSGDGSIVNFRLPSELQVDVGQGLGSIQAFADPQHNRSVVLVSTTADWSLVQPLFGYIDGSVGDWSQLTGDVLAAGAGGTPVNVEIRSADTAEPTPSASSDTQRNAYIAGGVVAALVVLAVALYLISRMRRKRRNPGPAGTPTADGSV